MHGGEALDLALGLLRAPARRELLAARPLPDGMTMLLEVAGGSSTAARAAAERTGASPEELLEAARFYVQQILLTRDADAYRVLGATADASQSQLHHHHRLLQRWLHPDRDGGEAWDSAFSARVNQAWTRVRNPHLRRAYDAERERRGEASPQSGPGWRRPLAPIRPGETAQARPRASALGPLAVLAAALACIVLIWLLHQRDQRTQAELAWPAAPVATAIAEGAGQPSPAQPAQSATAQAPANGLAGMFADISLDPLPPAPAGPPASVPGADASVPAGPPAPAPLTGAASASPSIQPAVETAHQIAAGSAAPAAAAWQQGIQPASEASVAVAGRPPSPDANPAAGNPVTGNPVTGNPVTGNVTTGNVTTGHVTTGNPVTGHSTPGHATTGHTAANNGIAANATTNSATTAPATAPADDPLQLLQQAQRTVSHVTAYLASDGHHVPPVWNDFRTETAAADARTRLHLRLGGQGRGGISLDDPHWRMDDRFAALQAGYRAGWRDGETGRLQIDMVRRDQRWLVTRVQLEPGR